MCKTRVARCARLSAVVQKKEKHERFLEERLVQAEKKGEFAGIPFHTYRNSLGSRVWAF